MLQPDADSLLSIPEDLKKDKPVISMKKKILIHEKQIIIFQIVILSSLRFLLF